jgi:hypothetical protein
MQEFFKELVVNPTDYTRAFEAGRLEVMRCDRPAADALCFLSTAPDAVDYVCFLCKNGRGEVPDADRISCSGSVSVAQLEEEHEDRPRKRGRFLT